ncbi:hypothetical protein D9758_003554 [Tetrapyrgos nigripes]|uniref:LysM domain-containing protein n=1 Tax=Tetrapyrgos nigripes TaxID=182062 RepID=A0A8H5GV37_9AGAR|nr:hypothetical protein D9758_003554 [Tetrapyrgos nigripes]
MVVVSTFLLASALTVAGNPLVRSPQHNPRNLHAHARAASTACSKTIVSGDLCYKIAASNDLTVSQLQSYNPGVNCNNLQIGAVLNLCPGTPTGVPTSISTTASTSAGCPTNYNKAGDYDEIITPKFGVTVDQLYKANPGLDWDDLEIGSSFNIPCSGTTSTSSPTSFFSSATSTTTSCLKYKVKAGDYDEIIAPKLGITVAQLYAANPGLDWDDLKIGSYLNIPCEATATSSSSSATSTVADSKTCGSSPIAQIIGALNHYQGANLLCSTILGRLGANSTPSGSDTVSQTTTTTATITSTATSTTTGTTTFSVDTTVTDLVVTETSCTVTTGPGTSTTIHFVHTVCSPNLGDVYSGSPNSLKKVVLDIARTACECFLGPVQVSTVISSTTITATVGITQTSTPSATFTVPAGTLVKVSTITETSTTPSTVTTTTTATATQTAQHTTATTTVSTTITAAPSTVTQTQVRSKYHQETVQKGCAWL